jgi:hypothetical protein
MRLYAISSTLVVIRCAAQLIRFATLKYSNLRDPDSKSRSMPVIRANCLNRVDLVPMNVQSVA